MTTWTKDNGGRISVRLDDETETYYALVNVDDCNIRMPWPTVSYVGELEDIVREIEGMLRDELTAEEWRFLLNTACGYDDEALLRDLESIRRFGQPGQLG